MAYFKTSDGLQLYYTDAGAGTPVLCLAGLTRNSRDFDYVAPALDGFRVITMDYRGRGKSDRAPHDTYAVPIEARDATELLDHLGLPAAAILGTSRGGLIAMVLAAATNDRLLGVCLNDIGPDLAPGGIEAIKTYLGRNPPQKTYAEAAGMRAAMMQGFCGVPESRWSEEVRKNYLETPRGLVVNYDPALREAVLEAGAQPAPDLWPLFDALEGLPLALIRGANSNLLTEATTAEMRRRRPDMIYANVPDRGHAPFLDEPAALEAIRQWLERLP
ncbi:MAG: alpha/beta hydrolase [Alphaproteobacteria bacterium]|nr:alpha/beta hydrolase [Alphaproteobacteria bacterium]NNF24131.1 alpha/beta hydrolase [Paracoccaceae bacterium]